MIKLGFMKGYVANIKDDYISMVNAQRHFSDLGLVLKENKEPDFENIQSCITVAAIGETNRRFTLSGLLFNYDTIRISNINGFNFELEPKGNLLMIENYDFPGVIGQIGTFLGKEGINIDSFSLARSKLEKQSMALVKIDGSATLDQIAALQSIEHVLRVKHVRL